MRKQKKDKLTRAIEAKERSIHRKREKIARLKQECEMACNEISATIPRDQYLLDGLKIGAPKP